MTLDEWKAALKTPAVKMCHVVPHDGWTCNGSTRDVKPGEREGGHKPPAIYQTEQSSHYSPPRTGPSRARAPATTARRGLARPFAHDPSGRPLDGGRHYCRGAVTTRRRAVTAVMWLPPASPPGARSHRTKEEGAFIAARTPPHAD